MKHNRQKEFVLLESEKNDSNTNDVCDSITT